MNNLLKIKNLKKEINFGGNKLNILNNINLEVREGEFISVMGASGSGKSTLLNIIAGIDRSTSGEVIVCGDNICKYNENELAKYRNDKIGIVFQNFNLISELTVLENILIPSFFRKRDMNIKNRAADLINLVGIRGKERCTTSQLSGGEQQRVAIARALLCAPKILLADEPTGALDSKTGEQMIQLFKECQIKLGTTIIMVTHEREIACKSERIVTIKDGEII